MNSNSLRETQQKFADALMRKSDEVVVSFANGRLLTAEDSLTVYQNNYVENLLKTMRLTFSVTEKIVGDAFFQKMASDYIMSHCSRSFDLNAYGESFSAFVSEYNAARELSYLSDVVMLEWLSQQCYLCDVKPAPFDFDAFTAVPDAQKAHIVFFLRKDIYFMQSMFPLLDIWKLNAGKFSGVVDLDVDQNFFLLIAQDTFKPVFVEVDEMMFSFLTQVANGACFEEVCDKLNCLTRAIQCGWISHFEVRENS